MEFIKGKKFLEMKHLYFIVLFLGFTILGSCGGGNDRCQNITCPPSQVCENGSCRCPFGLEGPNCAILSADKFIGNYQVNENCFNPPGPGFFYQSFINRGFNNFEIQIQNILGSGLTIRAIVDGNFISIPEQTTGNLRIVGQGNFFPVANRIEINYEYNFSGTLRSCTANFQKI